jgi:hypothetical protein
MTVEHDYHCVSLLDYLFVAVAVAVVPSPLPSGNSFTLDWLANAFDLLFLNSP